MDQLERGPKCDCPPGSCAKGVEPTSACIFLLDGDVRAVRCDKCGGTTWHHDGQCIKCMRDSSEVERLPVKQEVAGSIPAPAATFTVTVQSGANDRFTVPVERKLALKIIRMIMEAK